LTLEWNNTILTLVKKVRAGYVGHVMELFGRSDVPFSLDADWCAYLYMNGVITFQVQTDSGAALLHYTQRGKVFVKINIARSLFNYLQMSSIAIRT
jgi:hypothetical protein